MAAVQSIAVIASDLGARETLTEYGRRVRPPHVSRRERIALALGRKAER